MAAIIIIRLEGQPLILSALSAMSNPDFRDEKERPTHRSAALSSFGRGPSSAGSPLQRFAFVAE